MAAGRPRCWMGDSMGAPRRAPACCARALPTPVRCRRLGGSRSVGHRGDRRARTARRRDDCDRHCPECWADRPIPSSPPAVRSAGPPARALPVRGEPASAIVQLTGGNIRNGHIYLRRARHLLPDDVISGPNAEAAAPSQLIVTFEPGPTITTDVAGDKMILRQRGPVREFFADAAAREGDDVIIERTGPYSLRIALLRAAG